MKQTTCRDLKGACDEIIYGNTPQDMGMNSRTHVMKMVELGDEDHKQAIEEMQKLTPEEQKKWYEEFEATFDELSEAKP